MPRNRSLSRRVRDGALIVVLAPLVFPLALIAIVLHLLYRVALYFLVWTLWLPRGNDVLVVYSDSPIWHEYMTTQVLPLVEGRAILLNWSERRQWPPRSLTVAVFNHFGGDREFNPLVALFRPGRRAKLFRFWLPFKDWKHGYKEPVERLRQELSSALSMR
jgi:hypothetical protein